MGSLCDVDDASMDEALFELFKKEKIKELRSKLSASALRDIKNQKGVLPESGLKSRLRSAFGSSMNDKLLGEICHIFDKYCTSIPTKQMEDSENMILEILKLVVDVSSIHNNLFCTPCISKRKFDDSGIRPVIGDPLMKHKVFCAQKENNVCGRVLFESDENCGDKTAAVHAKKFGIQKSPEVVILKETNLNDKLNKMGSKAEDMYNDKFVFVNGSIPVANKTSEKRGRNRMNQGSSTLSFVSEGFPNNPGGTSVGGAECNDKSGKFPVTLQQKKNYNVVCSLSTCKQHSKSVIVHIGGCTLNFFSLGDSMAPMHQVCTFVVNCMCRKFFLDERPTISLKHYFFSSISIVFMSDSKDYSYVERCFNGAASVLPLPLCEMLFFPVLHGDHWFLFVVDLSNKLFLFLDSLFSKHHEFSVYTRKKLIVSFCYAWHLFVGTDPGFKTFRIAYPHVPKQTNSVDCGVFLIKFMELWKFGSELHNQFSQEDIPNIRIQIVNDLLMSKHNKADLDVVRNYNSLNAF